MNFYRLGVMSVRTFCFFILLLTFTGKANGQYGFITQAPAGERIRVLWKYCAYNFISDKDPESVVSFFDRISQIADSLGDRQLKIYVQYFKSCSLILFSDNYEQHFGKGDYQTVVRIFSEAREKANQQGYSDIVASAEHFMGQVYFRANRYGQAFEHLLKADGMMRQVGYQNIPAVSVYLYNLGLNYYRFEEFDKAQQCFLEAIRHPVYLSRNELNSLNAIGLIYAKKKNDKEALSYYQKTIERARAYKDTAWIGIASGNIGSVFMAKGDNEQALQYYRLNYSINSKVAEASNDAALSALYMSKAYTRMNRMDSALLYLHTGYSLGTKVITDKTEWLHFYKTYFEAGIEANKKSGNLIEALQLSDSLLALKDSIKNWLDSKILNRAVQKTEAARNIAELQLLQSRKNISQLYAAIVISALVVIIVVILLLFKGYRLRKLKQAQIAEKENQLLSLEKLRAEENLRHASGQLQTYLATIREKNEYIQLLDAEMSGLKESSGHPDDPKLQSAVIESLLSKTILTDDDWRHFRNLFEQVYPGFINRLLEKLPTLSPAETRMLILSRLNLSPREMANMLGISVDAIRKSRYRLRKKLNLSDEVEFNSIIQDR